MIFSCMIYRGRNFQYRPTLGGGGEGEREGGPRERRDDITLKFHIQRNLVHSPVGIN